MNNSLYSYRGSYIVSDIIRAINDWHYFLNKYKVKSDDIVILMAADDFEVNQYTLQCLIAIKSEKHVRKIYLIARNPLIEQLALQYATTEYVFVLWETDLFSRICRLYSVAPYFSNQVLINRYDNIIDCDGIKTVNGKGVTKEDVIARGFLRLKDTPDDQIFITRDSSKIGMMGDEEILDDLVGDLDISSVTYSSLDEYVNICVGMIKNNKNVKKSDRLIFFGVMKSSLAIMKKLDDYHIVSIIDNDKTKQGKLVDSIRVISPDEIRKYYGDDIKIIVTSKYYREMIIQLIGLGYKLYKQIIVAHVIKEANVNRRKLIVKLRKQINAGEKVYNRIRKVYPDEMLVFTPYPGTGDVMLVGMYIKTVVQEHAVNNYIHIVSAEHCKRILELFGENSIVVNLCEAESLLSYVRMRGNEDTNTFIACDAYKQPMYFSKDIDFNTEWQKAVFRVGKRITAAEIYRNSSDCLFNKHQLNKGRVVVLSPYTKSVNEINAGIWGGIARILTDKGFDVCTNVSSEEKAIPGTRAIFIPYNVIHDFLEKAGCFIGIRSGLCDVIAFCFAKKIILYPEEKRGEASMYSFFSLERMGLVYGELHELIVSVTDTENTVDRITSIVLQD